MLDQLQKGGHALNVLEFRTRVAVLWVAAAVAATGSVLLYLVMPGALEEMLAGEMEGETLNDALGFFMAMLVVIPVVMAAVTLLATDRANRYVNMIVGLLFGLFAAFAVVSHLLAGEFNGHILMAALGGALVFLIAGLSLVELRQQPTSQAAAPASDRSRPRERANA